MENVQIAISLLTLIGILFAVYKSIADPDIKASSRLDVIESTNNLKHAVYEKCFATIASDITSIKENHLHHIEQDVATLKGDIKAILAILNDRNHRQ